MKHLHKGRIFGREKAQRDALLKSLACSFFTHHTLKTSLAKAKEVQPMIERLLTTGCNNSLAGKRLIAKRLSPAIMPAVLKLSEKIRDQKGGYTRVVKLGQRKSDGAEMAIIELVK